MAKVQIRGIDWVKTVEVHKPKEPEAKALELLLEAYERGYRPLSVCVLNEQDYPVRYLYRFLDDYDQD